MRVLRTLVAVLLVGLAGSAAAGTYTVRAGDTLTAIGRRTGVGVADLVAANNLRNPDHIVVGAKLVVPGGGGEPPGAVAAPSTTHVVRRGDTLTRIARRYGVDLRALAAANDLTNLNLVRLGATLTVPGVASAPSASTPPASGPKPSLPARLRANPSRLALMPVFDRWAAEYGVPADLLKAMTWLESGWQNHVVSPVGAMGIGQLMPSTVTFVNRLLGASLDPGVADDNIRMSARFLRFLLDQTGGRADQALAGYYQGLASVRARGMFPVTVGYVQSVFALRPRF